MSWSLKCCCPAVRRLAMLPNNPLVGVEIIVEAWTGVTCRTTQQSWSQIIKKLIWFWWSFHWTVTHVLDKPKHESGLSHHHLASMWRHARTLPGKLVYWRCPNQKRCPIFNDFLLIFVSCFFLILMDPLIKHISLVILSYQWLAEVPYIPFNSKETSNHTPFPKKPGLSFVWTAPPKHGRIPCFFDRFQCKPKNNIYIYTVERRLFAGRG